MGRKLWHERIEEGKTDHKYNWGKVNQKIDGNISKMELEMTI